MKLHFSKAMKGKFVRKVVYFIEELEMLLTQTCCVHLYTSWQQEMRMDTHSHTIYSTVVVIMFNTG